MCILSSILQITETVMLGIGNGTYFPSLLLNILSRTLPCYKTLKVQLKKTTIDKDFGEENYLRQ